MTAQDNPREARIRKTREELERTETSELRTRAGRMYWTDRPDTRKWTHEQLVEWHLEQMFGS